MVQYDVGIYIGSNAAKHYNWSLDVIRAINEKIKKYAVISVDKGYVYQEYKKAGYEDIVLGEKIDERYLKGIKKNIVYIEKIRRLNAFQLGSRGRKLFRLYA